jgi:hypothetical protein
MTPYTSIKVSPETSVCGIEFGKTIAVGNADFVRLADAFFDELESKYV